jgi:ABC-type lipoprotein release transport system permease subunit
LIFTLLIFILSSVFFVKASIQKEIALSLDNQPDIVLQNIKAGRTIFTPTEWIDEIEQIHGIKSVSQRVYGWYKFDTLDKHFSVVGVDFFDDELKPSFQNIVKEIDFDKFMARDSMIVGEGVKDILNRAYYKDFLNFIITDRLKKVYIYDTFVSELKLETNDLILMDIDLAKEIFELDEDECSDIAIEVHNPTEIEMIATKIDSMFDSGKVIVKDDLRAYTQNLYDYKGGFFLSLFIVSLVTFVMILYFKASAMSKDEQKEIAIIRSLGWSINDVLIYKMIESLIISLVGFITALILALVYVYYFDAYLLDRVFFGFSNITSSFELIPAIDLDTISVLFFVSVPLYICASRIQEC